MAEKKYVIFRLNSEEYGIDINTIKEVSEYKKVTPIPGSPHCVEGVVNLRGEIISIINLKRKLGLEDRESGSEGKIIVTNITKKLSAFLVDDASHIITMDDKNIDSSDDMISHFRSEYMEGIGKVNERIVIFLNLNSLINN